MGAKLTFYFDRCFGKRFPETLKHINPPFCVESHYSLNFSDKMKDDDWLAYVGQKAWIVFSHDRKFHRNLSESMAIYQNKVGCFYLPGAKSTSWDKLRTFARVYPVIVDLIIKVQKPFIYQIPISGPFKEILIKD